MYYVYVAFLILAYHSNWDLHVLRYDTSTVVSSTCTLYPVVIPWHTGLFEGLRTGDGVHERSVAFTLMIGATRYGVLLVF